jgi:hypothetical protein
MRMEQEGPLGHHRKIKPWIRGIEEEIRQKLQTYKAKATDLQSISIKMIAENVPNFEKDWYNQVQETIKTDKIRKETSLEML